MADESNPTVTTILKSVLIGIVSRGLAIVSAWAIAKGLVAPELLSADNLAVLAVGIASGLITLGWLVRAKIRNWYLVQAAKDAPQGTQMSVIKTEANNNSPV